jgi:signal transduction histidine kinase
VARWKTLSLLELSLTPIWGSQRVSVSVGLREGLAKILADRVQLQRVFLNLIMNAMEAMGPVADRACLLRIRSEIHDASRILVTVEDSGRRVT